MTLVFTALVACYPFYTVCIAFSITVFSMLALASLATLCVTEHVVYRTKCFAWMVALGFSLFP